MVLDNNTIIDQSLDIIHWALTQHDPDNWLPSTTNEQQIARDVIEHNDNQFAILLTRYKYADRYPEHTEQYYRQQAENFVQHIETKLLEHEFVINDRLSYADIALLPFIE